MIKNNKMHTYLSNDKIKTIANYLNNAIPKKTLEYILFWENKGIEFNYNDFHNGHTQNIQKIWNYISVEILKQNNQQAKDLKRLIDGGHFFEAGEIINKYINVNYKQEYETVKNTNLPDIYNKICGINGILFNSHLHKSINLNELLQSQNYEKYLTDNFGESTIPTELLKETERIAKIIDSQYYGRRGIKEYQKYQYAIKEYMISGDKNLLHNLLNIE